MRKHTPRVHTQMSTCYEKVNSCLGKGQLASGARAARRTHTGVHGEQACARERFWVLTVCECQIAASDRETAGEGKIIGIIHLQLVTTVGRVWREAHLKLVGVLCARPRVSACAHMSICAPGRCLKCKHARDPAPARMQSTVNAIVGVGTAASAGTASHDSAQSSGREHRSAADGPAPRGVRDAQPCGGFWRAPAAVPCGLPRLVGRRRGVQFMSGPPLRNCVRRRSRHAVALQIAVAGRVSDDDRVPSATASARSQASLRCVHWRRCDERDESWC